MPTCTACEWKGAVEELWVIVTELDGKIVKLLECPKCRCGKIDFSDTPTTKTPGNIPFTDPATLAISGDAGAVAQIKANTETGAALVEAAKAAQKQIKGKQPGRSSRERSRR